MASSFPLKKNTAVRIVFPILDADGDPVTGAAGDTPDSEYSLNGGSFSDCSNEISELATASGIYYLDLLAAETNGDVVCIQIKTATGTTKTTVLVFYTAAQTLDELDVVADAIKAKTDLIGASVAPASEYDTELDATISSRSSHGDPDPSGYLDVSVASRAPAGEYDTQMGSGERASASLLATAQADLDNPNQFKATGFSTHAAADIWSVGTRTLTSFGSLIQDIWDKLTSGLTQVGSIGKLLVDNVNATISSRSSHGDPDPSNYIDASIAGRAPSGEYDAQLDVVLSTRATPDQVDTEIDEAIENYRLDELMVTPLGSQPAAGSLLGDLSEDDAGTQRFTQNALEQGPSGTPPSVLIGTTIDGITSQTIFTLIAGSDIDDAYDDQAIVLYDASNNDYPSVRKIIAYVGASKTVTIDEAPEFNIISGDGVKVFVTAPGATAPTASEVADAVWEEDIADHTTGTKFGGKNQKVVPSETLADYKATGFSTHGDPDPSGYLDVSVASRASASALATAQADLDNPNQYKADVSSLALEATLTAMKGAGWSDESLKGIIDAVAGLNDLADSEVWAYVTRTLTDPASYKADVSALGLEATLTAMKGSGWTDESLKDIQDLATTLEKIATNRWKIIGNQLIIYEDNGSTPLFTFDLKDSAGDPAMEDVYERVIAS